MLTGKNNHKDVQCQRRLWDEISVQLNSLYGPVKTADKWKETMSNWKKQLRSRARKIKAERDRTGGGPFTGETLSDLEQEALSVFGMSAINGLGRPCLGFENTSQCTSSAAAVSPSQCLSIECEVPSPALSIDIASPGLSIYSVPPSPALYSDCTIPSPDAEVPSPPARSNKKITKQEIYNVMLRDMKEQKEREEKLAQSMDQMGKGIHRLADILEKIFEKNQ